MTQSIRSELLRGLAAVVVCILLAMPAFAAEKFWTDPKTGDTWTTDPQVCGPRAGFEGESWVAIQTWTDPQTGDVWTTDPRATGPRVDFEGCSWAQILRWTDPQTGDVWTTDPRATGPRVDAFGASWAQILVWVDPATGATWTTDPNAVGSTWTGWGHTWTNIPTPLSRPAAPVVLTGEDLPMFRGTAPDSLVAFRYAGVWVQIPIQVDERDVRSYGEIYNFLISFGLGSDGSLHPFVDEFYTDPGTFMGPDTDPMLDDNDEVVFMARDTGNIATAIADPPGVIAGSRAKVRVRDPLDGTTGYVYLFQSAGGLDPSAGQSYVDYQFKLQSGDYLETFDLMGPCPQDFLPNGGILPLECDPELAGMVNFELSTASSEYYERTFTSRWLTEVLRITAPGASGVDILDRRKFRFQNPPMQLCDSGTEASAEELEGAFVANKSGPVRGIRSHMGFRSGAGIQQVHFFYEQREDIVLHWRVHDIGATFRNFVDYDPAAIGMTYFNDNNTGGVIIDGVPDSVIPGVLEWELVSGSPGSLVIIHDLVTSFPSLLTSSYYLDDASPVEPQCTGDAFAIGSSGPTIAGTPNTDPRDTSNTLAFVSSRYYGPPRWTVAKAKQLRAFSENPLVTTVPNN